MRGVDKPTGLDTASFPGEQRRDDAVVANLAHREVLDATRGQKSMPHGLVVVAHHLCASGERVETCIQADLIDNARAERS